MNRNRILILLCVLLVGLALLACGAGSQAACPTCPDLAATSSWLSTRVAEIPTVRALMTQEAQP